MTQKLLEALKTIAEFPRTRKDELGYERCREIARAALSDFESQPSGWISVESQLPELGIPVWLHENGRIYVGGRSDEGEGWLWGNCYGSHYMDDGVWKCDIEIDDEYEPTMWMALPSIPKPPEAG